MLTVKVRDITFGYSSSQRETVEGNKPYKAQLELSA